MKYIGCDFHPSFQQIAMLDKETGELVERRLLHTQEARVFYEGLQGPVVVGVEASGNMDWFESLLAHSHPVARNAVIWSRRIAKSAMFRPFIFIRFTAFAVTANPGPAWITASSRGAA